MAAAGGFEGREVVCYQMDLYQAQRLDFALRERDLNARIVVAPDLWDLPQPLSTLVGPPSRAHCRTWWISPSTAGRRQPG